MTPRRILVAGWLVFLLYAYPGYLMTEGADELADSRVGEFTDWHSPVMTEVWRIVGGVLSGPAGMLLLQSLLLVGGSYQLLRRTMSDRAAAATTVFVLLFPPILATTAVISAEAQLAGFLVAAAAALASRRPRIRLLGLGLMIVACGMQGGAALAALPIVVATFRWRDHHTRWQRLALAAAAWVAVVLAATGLARLLVDVASERNAVALAMADIAGTLHYADDLDDARIQRLLDGVTLVSSVDIQRRARTPAAATGRLLEPPTTATQRDALFAGRWALVRAAPAGYLVHRWHVVRRVLGLSRSGPWWPLYTEAVPTSDDREGLQHAASHSLLQATLIAPVRWLSRTFLFRPYVYLILAIVLVPVAARRGDRAATMLMASAVLYALVLMFVTTRAEYRDSHWMIVATALAIATLVARGFPRLEPRHERVGDDAAVLVAQHDHV